jgi:predicted DNA-binding WGR domain protein
MHKGFLIDEYCTAQGGQLYEHPQNGVYSCTLNQTDIRRNANKFYIIQIVQSGSSYYLYVRYGRVGAKGVTSQQPYHSAQMAASDFEGKFREKTGNHWYSREQFQAKPKKYFLANINYAQEMAAVVLPPPAAMIPSQLPRPVQDLITMLSDRNMMQQALVNLEIDLTKMPLGKITQQQLDMARAVLDQLQHLVVHRTFPTVVSEVARPSFAAPVAGLQFELVDDTPAVQSPALPVPAPVSPVPTVLPQVPVQTPPVNTTGFRAITFQPAAPRSTVARPAMTGPVFQPNSGFTPLNFQPTLNGSFRPVQSTFQPIFASAAHVLTPTFTPGPMTQPAVQLVLQGPTTLSSAHSTSGVIPLSEGHLNMELVNLSSRYYTYVPVNCGRNIPPVINNTAMIDKCRQVLDDLSNISVGVKIIDQSQRSTSNPIDSVYQDINTKIEPLARNSQMWAAINTYVTNSHGRTHSCKLQVMEIFTIEQAGKRAKFEAFSNQIGNHTLLFHGTPTSCGISIMKRDFYLNPEVLGASITGKMFGLGLYFANCSSKSFGYTRAETTGGIGCMFLAQVALGTSLDKLDSDSGLNKSKLDAAGCHSTKGIGRLAPASSVEVDGVKIPLGAIAENPDARALNYDEFIIYHVDQQLIRFLVLVKDLSSR